MKKHLSILLLIAVVLGFVSASGVDAATFNQVLDRWSKSVKYIDREDDISNLEIEATYYSAEFIEAYIQREAENNLWTKQEADDYKYKFLQALRLDEMIPIQVKFINNGPTMHLGPFDIMVKLIIKGKSYKPADYDKRFNFAFQGSGKRGFFLNPSALSPFVNDHAMLKEIYESHWTEKNTENHPFWPRLSVTNITDYNQQENWYANITDVRKSTYFMRECRFLRCTSLELAYNLPKKITDRFRMQNVKFFARANNPFLITNFKTWDVELGEDGFNYPIQKTYALGLNISF